MIKKLAIILFIFIMAFLFLSYFQIEKIRIQLISTLEKNDIIFSKVALNVFPVPSVIIYSPTYSYKKDTLSFSSAKFNLSISLFLSKELAVKDISLSGGNNQSYNISELDIHLSKTELSVNDMMEILDVIKNDQFLNRTLTPKEFDLDIHFQSQEGRKNHLFSHITLNKTIDFSHFYFAHSLKNGDEQTVLKINQGKIEKENNLSYKLWFDDLWINSGHFTDITTRLTLPENENLHYHLAMTSKDDYINVNLFQRNKDKQSFDISIFSLIEASELLKSFKFPVILSGKTNLNAHFITKSFEILTGNYQLLSENGVFYGIGLLSMVGQYMPINYDEDRLKNKNIDTAFHHFYLSGDYTDQIFSFSELSLSTDDFITQGDGKASLVSGECDINLKVGLNRKKYIEYSTLKLPLHFWGQCSNPQYEVVINKSLLNQLKPLLLKKLFRH